MRTVPTILKHVIISQFPVAGPWHVESTASRPSPCCRRPPVSTAPSGRVTPLHPSRALRPRAVPSPSRLRPVACLASAAPRRRIVTRLQSSAAIPRRLRRRLAVNLVRRTIDGACTPRPTCRRPRRLACWRADLVDLGLHPSGDLPKVGGEPRDAHPRLLPCAAHGIPTAPPHVNVELSPAPADATYVQELVDRPTPTLVAAPPGLNFFAFQRLRRVA